MKKIFNFIRKIFPPNPVEYRHGEAYFLFYKNYFLYRVYVIQKTDWLGDYYNIFETESKQVYLNKVKEMELSGIKFKKQNN